MKITVNGFEIEFKAKVKSLRSNYNKKDTESFANWLCVVLSEMSDYYRLRSNNTDNDELKECRSNIADYFERDSNYIYTMLRDLGIYDKYL